MAFYSSKNSFSIIAEIDTYNPSTEGFQYPYNIKFISSDAATINKNYLEVPIAENWEMGVTSINYKVINSKTILVPTPTHAKATNVYDLYAGEILFGPVQFFPIQYPTKDCIRLKNEDNVDLDRFCKDAYNITDTQQLQRFKYSFEPLMNMNDRLYIGMFDSGVTPLQRSEFYARDMNTPAGQPLDPDLLAEINANKDNKYYIDLSTYHSPILRWNFTDILYTLFPNRFTLHSNKYGLFSLDELWTAPFFNDQVLANAQSLLDNKKVLGFVKAGQIQERHFYANIRNALPKFAVIKTIGELHDKASEKLQPHCTIKTPPTCMYIALGDTICKLSGYHKIRDTYDLTTKTKYRKKLGIIINTMEDAFIGSCSMKWHIQYKYRRMTPVFHHDGENGAEQQSSRRQWLWKLPATSTYSDDVNFYYWVQDPGRIWSDDHYLTRTIESHNALQFFNAGELFIYCDNSIEATSHIGNYISPLLDKIPAPSFAFGKTLINTSYIDFSSDQISTQLDIKNPIFKSLKPRINLADAQAQLLNEYGEPVFCGILTLELVARRKGTQ